MNSAVQCRASGGAAGRKTAALEADVTDRAAVEAHVARMVERVDRCDALVNDAAIEEPQPLLETCHARA